jgi:two-component system, NarL family, sensor histidine kinase UhpB
MGVTLHWSMARLPEIAGVTPSHALNVLRILQEGITNAIKHGQATRISVLGGRDSDGNPCIEVENNGIPFPCNPDQCGMGLNSMRRRIRQLNGTIEIKPHESGTRLAVLLPLRLPESSVGFPDNGALE